MLYQLNSAFGLAVIILLCWLLSENRKAAPWRLVAWALGLQVGLGLVLLPTEFGELFFEKVDRVFGVITTASKAGSGFLFGNLTEVISFRPGVVDGSDGPFVINAVLAFHVLPIIIFVSCLAAMLYHLRVIQAGVRGMAWLMTRTLKTSGAETFGAGLLVFFGIESMPTLKGYLQDMTRSELCTIMTVFMSTIAADVMVIYAAFGAAPGRLLTASLMSAPAAILVSKLLVPETEEPQTRGATAIEVPVESHNLVDAASRGASQGVQLAINVGALLIAFVAVVALIDIVLQGLTSHSFQEVVGWLFYPFAFLMGTPIADLQPVSQLLGTKTVLNEFLAYVRLNELVQEGVLQDRSVTIATFALCGFANPGSLGILLAGLSALIPGRRRDVAQLGVKCFVGGTLAVFMTACVAGMLTAP